MERDLNLGPLWCMQGLVSPRLGCPGGALSPSWEMSPGGGAGVCSRLDCDPPRHTPSLPWGMGLATSIPLPLIPDPVTLPLTETTPPESRPWAPWFSSR